MLVSHQFRFIFVKTKKTGSSTTEKWLKRYCTADGDITSTHGVGRDALDRNHTSSREVLELIGEQCWNDYLSIVNVRNPWDKLVSLLFFRPARTARFADGRVEITSVEDARTRLERMALGFSRSECDAFLEVGAPPIDRVIRLDRIDDELRAIADELDLPDRDAPLVQRKATVRPDWARDWRPLYTDAAIEAVASEYADWIETFGYTFDSKVAAR